MVVMFIIMSLIMMCPVNSFSAGKPCQIVLISIDTLRADHLGCYGYNKGTSPQLDTFAEKSVLFRQATCQAPWTTGSFASMMTGRFCSEALANYDQLNPHLSTLAELLRAKGITTVAVISNPELNSARGFGRGFTHYLELFRPSDHKSTGKWKKKSKVGAAEVTDAVLKLLPQLADKDFFLWILYLEPHTPYIRHGDEFFPGGWPKSINLPIGQEVPTELIIPEALKSQGPDAASRLKSERETGNLIFKLYDGQIRYLDQQLERLLDGLETTGTTRHSLIIVTSDHGESVYDHKSYYGHGRYPYQGTVHVPLIIRWPESKGAVVDETVALVDLFPTVLEFAGIEVPTKLRGSALSPAGRNSQPAIIMRTDGQNKQRALRRGPYKLIYWDDNSQSLFNVINDPGEKIDLCSEKTQLVRKLGQKLGLVLRTLDPSPADLPDPLISPQLKEQMRALGYVD